MFRGPAALMRRNPMIWWVFGGGCVVCVLAFLAPMLLPGIPKGIYHAALAIPMLTVYPVLVTRGLKPKFTPVNLYVDQNGIWANDTPLVARRDIAQASIRPALASKQRHISSSGGAFSLTLPAYPMTVELITARGKLFIDPGSDQAAAAILTALGFPVVYSPPFRLSLFQRRS
jgi:hypothetical protein